MSGHQMLQKRMRPELIEEKDSCCENMRKQIEMNAASTQICIVWGYSLSFPDNFKNELM
jgi:hypothetical protein